MARSLSPGRRDAPALLTIKRGKLESERDNAHNEDPPFSILLLFFSYSLQPAQFSALPSWDTKAGWGASLGPWPSSPPATCVCCCLGFVQVPPKTTRLISFILQTHCLMKMLSQSLGGVGLFLCKHSRLS